MGDHEVEEAYVPGRFAYSFQLDELTGEGAGQEELVLAPADAAGSIDVAGLVPGRRFRFDQLARITARRTPGHEGGWHVAERFMRPILVVVATPLVDDPPLLDKVLRGGRHSFFERQVASLEAAILLRLAWFDALELNAELQPPH